MNLNFHITFNFLNVKINILSIIVLSVLLSIFFTQTGSAASFQLSGVVSDNSNIPIAKASIEVINTDTNTVVARTESSADGYYNIVLEGGSYTIKVTSIDSSDLKPDISLYQTIAKDTVFNIIIVSDSSDPKRHLYNIITNPFYK